MVIQTIRESACLRFVLPIAALAAALAGTAPATAGAAPQGVLAAVATNFAEVVKGLEPRFESETGYVLTVATGSTGKLYAQIAQGAPFDVFLAADEARPRRLETEGLAVPGSRFTYAVGRLALWSPDPARIGPDGERTLAEGRFRTLAIANPELAPYGAAAREVLAHLGLLERLRERLVMGQSVAQTYAMIATGNADLGFVALSELRSPRHRPEGSRWEVPQRLHRPIRQDAVLLTRAASNRAARAFLAFLREPAVLALVAAAGYRPGQERS